MRRRIDRAAPAVPLVTLGFTLRRHIDLGRVSSTSCRRRA